MRFRSIVRVVVLAAVVVLHPRWAGAQSSGACCLPDGSCVFVSMQQCSTLTGGVFVGNVPCSAVTCPRPTGACCYSNRPCEVLTQSDCTAGGGNFRGLNTVCFANTCPIGACCNSIDGACVLRTSFDCGNLGSQFIYKGDGSSCGPNPCDPTGACCLSDFTCIVRTSLGCSLANGVYKGNGTVCSATICRPSGACCTGLGSCAVTLDNQCTTGQFFAGGVCSPSPCVISGACCRASGACTIVSQGQSFQCERGFFPLQACDPCPPLPVGSCCTGGVACQVLSAFACGSGVWTSGGVCTPSPCVVALGVCCGFDGTCVAAPAGCGVDCATACAAQGRVFNGPNRACTSCGFTAFAPSGSGQGSLLGLPSGPSSPGRLALSVRADGALVADGSTGGGVIPGGPVGSASASSRYELQPRRLSFSGSVDVTLGAGNGPDQGAEVVSQVQATFVVDVDCTVSETAGSGGTGVGITGVPKWIGQKVLAGTYPVEVLAQIRRVGSQGAGTSGGSRSLTQVLTPSPCRPDIDGVAGLSPADLFLFLSEYFAGRGDFNRDGVRNPTDIFAYLSAYFARC
jgi:hypothetical protein